MKDNDENSALRTPNSELRTSKKTILSFGETLWDIFPGGRRVLGGAPFNFAYRCRGLGDEGLIVTRLGRDDLGLQAHRQLRSLGMDDRFVQFDAARPTGTVNVTLGPSGPDYFIVPEAAYDHLAIEPALLAAAARADCVCFGTLAQRSEESRRALVQLLKAGYCLKLLDVNLRKDCFNRQTVGDSLWAADILRCNNDETVAVADLLGFRAEGDLPGRSAGARRIENFCREAMRRYPLSHVVVTMGKDGAMAMARDGVVARAAGFPVKVVDTVGSGDAFTAGFIHRFLRGESLERCLELGNALGAMVAAQAGGTSPIAPDDLQRFLAEHARSDHR